jgi:hypothetical protein
MSSERIPLRIGFLMFLGLAIGVLFIMAGTNFWNRNPREGALLLGLAVGLAVIFFRRRLLALSILALGVVIALFSMGAISHRSVSASIIALVALAIAYLLIRWDVKKHPARAFGDWQSLFDDDERPS